MYWKKVSFILSFAVIGVGAAVLLGWVLDIEALKRIHPQLVTMKANTAVCLILAATSLALLRDEIAAGFRRRLAQACAVMIALVGALIGHATGIGLEFLHRPKEFGDRVNGKPATIAGPQSPVFFSFGGSF